MGLAPRSTRESPTRQRQIQGGSFIDYLLPTASDAEVETGHTVTPSPHHRWRQGRGESATVGAPAAIANA